MWERPTSVLFPSVWKKFKGRREINGVLPTFWIQDIPLDEFENIVNCMINKFCGDEPLTKYSGVVEDQQSIEEFTEMWREALKDKLGIICYMENPDKNGKPIFAGVNCTHKKIKRDDNQEELKLSGKAICKIMNTMDYVMKQNDAFKIVDTDVLLSALGLYVPLEFRGQNIGLELLNAREDLCKAVGIKASITVFTANASQILADRAGFKILCEIAYEDLEKINPQFAFPGIEKHTKTIKYMYKVFDL